MTSGSIASDSLLANERADRRQRIWAIFGSSSGNLVEWFDFYAYAFTALYFAPAFFPKGNQTTQLLQTAAVFAIGFLMRPIGGYVFGFVADKYGRKKFDDDLCANDVRRVARYRFAPDLWDYWNGSTGVAAACAHDTGSIGRWRVWYQRYLHERSGAARQTRLLCIIPVCHADWRTTACLARCPGCPAAAI